MRLERGTRVSGHLLCTKPGHGLCARREMTSCLEGLLIQPWITQPGDGKEQEVHSPVSGALTINTLTLVCQRSLFKYLLFVANMPGFLFKVATGS